LVTVQPIWRWPAAAAASALLLPFACGGTLVREWSEQDADSTGASTTTTDPTAPTAPEPHSGSGQLTLDGSTTDEPDPCQAVDCPPGEWCVDGVCFGCPPSWCSEGCEPGEYCECAPDDPCCTSGTCISCPFPALAGNHAACLDVDGMLSNEPCDGGHCVTDDRADPTVAICMSSGCEDVCQCPSVPPVPGIGPTPMCDDIDGDAINDCWLRCVYGQSCPNGMECHGGRFCMYPQPSLPPLPTPVSYGDCADNPVSTCRPGEYTCLADAAESAAACSSGCLAPADCPPPPPTGTAPVACSDFGGGDVCYLDCVGGQACPVGTMCTAVGGGMACLWPDDGFLLDEDFEQAALRPGWSVIDVDGNVPDASVAFVTDAFVVDDELEPGANFGAYSTSWYAPAAQADDWLVTPQVMLGPASDLSWRAWAPDPSYPDGYEVRVSTGMPTVPDFLANPAIFTIADEADPFAMHAVDLAAAGYASQAVYIAFRNDSFDEFLLVIDDVRVTE
jgi:hypothetical protein